MFDSPLVKVCLLLRLLKTVEFRVLLRYAMIEFLNKNIMCYVVLICPWLIWASADSFPPCVVLKAYLKVFGIGFGLFKIPHEVAIDDTKTKEHRPLTFNIFKNAKFPSFIMQSTGVLFWIHIPENKTFI